MASCLKWSSGLNASVILPRTVKRACQLAMAAPKGAVFVSVPTEFLMEAMSADAPPAVLAVPPSAQPAAIEDLARALSEAKNPVIVTEEVGKSTTAVRSLVAIAELLGAPVLDAWQPYYVNFPRDHPLYGGVVAEDMEEVLREADLVFLVEAVAPWHPPSALPAAHASGRPGRGPAALQPALLGVSDRPDRGGRARRFACSARRAGEKNRSFRFPQGVYRALARPA